MFCPNCGKELPKGAESCEFCGRIIISSAVEKSSELKNSPVIPQAEEKTVNSSHSHLTKGILLVSGIIIIMLIISLICIWPRAFNPQKISESGTYELHQGESVYFDSIASTLMFSEAQIDSIDYDTLSLNLIWKLQLKPEKKLNSNDKNEFNYCTKWITSAHLNGADPMINISAHTDYLENCVYFTVRGNISCREDPSSLRCTVNNSLGFDLLYDFPFSFEDIAMEKVKIDIDKKDYAEASSILQEINTPEDQTMLEGIKCIDYAEGLIDKLTFEYSMLFLTGIEFTFEYDPVSYTFYEFMTMSDLYDAIYSFALYEDPDPKVANEEALLSNAKDLYTDYFYPEGYTGITCTVIERNRSGDIWGQASYTNENSLAPSPTPSSQPGNKPSTSNTTDFPPAFTPITGYSDYLGEYIDEYGRILEVSVGTGEGISYFINIYANQADAINNASPLLTASHGTLEYRNGYMIIAFEDSSGNGLYFERDNFIEDNYTLYVYGSPYVDGCDMESFLDTTFYMTEQYIDPMA